MLYMVIHVGQNKLRWSRDRASRKKEIIKTHEKDSNRWRYEGKWDVQHERMHRKHVGGCSSGILILRHQSFRVGG